MLSSHRFRPYLLWGWLASVVLASAELGVPSIPSLFTRQQASVPDFVTRYGKPCSEATMHYTQCES